MPQHLPSLSIYATEAQPNLLSWQRCSFPEYITVWNYLAMSVLHTHLLRANLGCSKSLTLQIKLLQPSTCRFMYGDKIVHSFGTYQGGRI